MVGAQHAVPDERVVVGQARYLARMSAKWSSPTFEYACLFEGANGDFEVHLVPGLHALSLAQVEPPASKKAKDVPSSALAVASVAIKGAPAASQDNTKSVSSDSTSGTNTATEEARAAFQDLQEVARLDAQVCLRLR